MENLHAQRVRYGNTHNGPRTLPPYEHVPAKNRPFGLHAVGSRFRLYIDEVGHHRWAAPDEQEPIRRYFGLVGVIVEETQGRHQLQGALDGLVTTHFPEAIKDEDPPVLHLADIRSKKGPFSVLNDPERCRAFHGDMIRFLAQAEFATVTAVVDKSTHFAKDYRARTDPYHYGIEILLERYLGILQMCEATGDVMAEARSPEADQQLEAEFESLRSDGTRFQSGEAMRRALSSSRVKIKPKWKRIAGLQLADLVAHPMWRQVLEKQGRLHPDRDSLRNRIREATAPKINRQLFDGTIKGYGEKFLD